MKIKAIYFYLLFVLWVMILALLLKFAHLNVTGLGITLIFLTLIFSPGVMLCRLLGVKTEILAAKLLYFIGLGFGFHFLINLLALVLGATLNQVVFLDIFGIIILFSLALFYDRQTTWMFDLKNWFKKQALSDWLLLVILIGGSLAAFLAVNAQSDAFVGDTYFHLGILNKIVTAANLNPHNLWPVKDASLNIVYSFPIWHILVAEVAKLLNINVFTAYAQILLPLVILSLLVWWGFARTFFTNRYLAGVIYLAFLAYFLSAGSFYALVPLRSPDSLNRLLIFPLLLALTADYLFAKSQRIWPKIIFLSFLGIFMGLIHFTQLIEYFLILLFSIILFLIFSRQKEVLKRAGLLLLVLGGTILSYLGVFQSETARQFLINNAGNFTEDTFRNKSYQNTNIFNLYAVFALPFLILLFRKANRLIFLVSIPFVLMMITWEAFQLRPFFLKYFGEIFVARAITDIPGFIFFGLLILLVILGLNFLFGRIRRPFTYILYICLTAILCIIFIPSWRDANVKFLDESIFTGKNLLMYSNFWEILVILSFLAIVVYVTTRFYLRKTVQLPSEPKDKLNFVILVFVFFLLLFLPYYADFSQKITHNFNGSILANRQLNYFGEIPIIGGEKTVKFLENFSSEDVFAISNVYVAQIALLYCRCYTAEYPYGIAKFDYSTTLFDPSITLEKRREILDKHSIDYIVAFAPSEEEIFSNYPETFEIVFDNHYTYQVESKKKGIYQKEGEFVIFKYRP